MSALSALFTVLFNEVLYEAEKYSVSVKLVRYRDHTVNVDKVLCHIGKFNPNFSGTKYMVSLNNQEVKWLEENIKKVKFDENTSERQSLVAGSRTFNVKGNKFKNMCVVTLEQSAYSKGDEGHFRGLDINYTSFKRLQVILPHLVFIMNHYKPGFNDSVFERDVQKAVKLFYMKAEDAVIADSFLDNAHEYVMAVFGSKARFQENWSFDFKPNVPEDILNCVDFLLSNKIGLKRKEHETALYNRIKRFKV